MRGLLNSWPARSHTPCSNFSAPVNSLCLLVLINTQLTLTYPHPHKCTHTQKLRGAWWTLWSPLSHSTHNNWATLTLTWLMNKSTQNERTSNLHSHSYCVRGWRCEEGHRGNAGLLQWSTWQTNNQNSCRSSSWTTTAWQCHRSWC